MKKETDGKFSIFWGRIIFGMIHIILLTGISVEAAELPDWYRHLKTIEPLITVRRNVEMSIGPGRKIVTGNSGTTVEYSVGDATFEITYSLGRCKGYIEKYRVEKDVVLDIDLTLTKPVSFSSVLIDVTNYEKIPIEDLVGRFTYANLDVGERIDGTATKLFSMQRFPRAELEKAYRCVD